MGVWSSAAKFLSKQAERAMLVFSGMQWGDSSNDSEKAVAAVSAYQNLRSVEEKLAAREDNSALVYIVAVLVIAVIIFIVVLCLKMMIDNVKCNARSNDNRRENIQLNTIRASNRSTSA